MGGGEKQRLLLSELRNNLQSTKESLYDQLRKKGFACLALDDPTFATALEDGLLEAEMLTGFRFPPNDEQPTIYNQRRRRAFGALFSLSLSILDTLIEGQRVSNEIRDALDGRARTHFPLFGTTEDSHEPFEVHQPFSQSFFNLFNYDNGLLNPHVDRSLVTVIKTKPAVIRDGTQSALWIKSREGQWTNADRFAAADEIVIMIGEDLEAMPFITDHELYAAEHAVRVDPTGPYIPHSHFRRDPSTGKTGNRLSAAFILRHEG